MDGIELIGLSEADVLKYAERKKTKGRRDQRVCVCGHGGNAHSAADLSGRPVDELKPGEVVCQVGRVPCLCNEFKWVLTIEDIRSFIQKTEGPGPEHALSKGLQSSAARGHHPTWREGIRCFFCKRAPEASGTLVPIAFNDRGGEARRSTPTNMLFCGDCRARFLSGDFSVPDYAAF